MAPRLPSLILFARNPRAGRVKTRLTPALSGDEAAFLYGAFLEDAARVYRLPEKWESVLAADPDPEEPPLSSLFASGWRREKQASGDLGQRLANAFEGEFALGAPAVVAVGSDHPSLSRRLLVETFERLSEGADVSIIPADDGGYCAIGLTPRVRPLEIFRAIPWSTSAVLDATRERAATLGLRLALLEPAYDVDRPEDLDRLARDLASRDREAPDYPSATARAMATLAPAVLPS